MKLNEFRAERDAIATLGLLAHLYFEFDAPISRGGSDPPTHYVGLNVVCAILDNSDGELLAIERNSIHRDESPLQHAEQRALRPGIERIRKKRPRAAGVAIETYYQTLMFMGKGTDDADFDRLGCTLYNAFDPCPMCAATLLIAYMKRIAYVLSDLQYDGFYDALKKQHFASRQSLHGKVELPEKSGLIGIARDLVDGIEKRVDELLAQHVNLINVFDHCRDELERAATILAGVTPKDLVTQGDEKAMNARTLADFKAACNLPSVPM